MGEEISDEELEEMERVINKLKGGKGKREESSGGGGVLNSLKFWGGDDGPKKMTVYLLNVKEGTYETEEVPIEDDEFEHGGQKYNIEKNAIYTHKPNPLKVIGRALFGWLIPDKDIDTSDTITSHMLDPSRIVDEIESDSSTVIEHEEETYDIDRVFTGPRGDMVLHNRGDAIPKPEVDYDDEDSDDDFEKYDDPSVALKERQFNKGILKKISQMPSGGLGIDLGSIPPWAIILLFIIVILVLGG